MKQQPIKQKPKSNNFNYQPAGLRPGPMPSDHAQSPRVRHYRNIGNQAVLRMMETEGIQAKLEIGSPDDKYEQEADRIADQVMRMSEKELPLVNSHWSLGKKEEASCPGCMEAKSMITPLVQKLERDTLEVEEEKLLRSKDSPVRTTEVTPRIEAGINSLKGGGQPLSESTRSFFEPRFGVDFSNVRVHTDPKAVQTAQSINAQAYTIGSNIVFNNNRYAPDSINGKHLLAHELTHVTQQLKREKSIYRVPGVDVITRAAPYANAEESTYFNLDLPYWWEKEINESDLVLLDIWEIGELLNEIRGRNIFLRNDLLSQNEQILNDELGRRIEEMREMREEANILNPTQAEYLRYLDQIERYDPLNRLLEISEQDTSNQMIFLDNTVGYYREESTELEGLCVGNFDFLFDGFTIYVTVRVKFLFEDSITAQDQQSFETKFFNAITTYWTNSGYGLNCTGNCAQQYIPIDILATKVTDDSYHKLVDVEAAVRRPNVISDMNLYLGIDEITIAHEFGHVLGLYDEYDGGWFENLMFWHDSGAFHSDTDALMNIGSKLRVRYFEAFKESAQSVAPGGCNYSISSTPPVP